MKDEYLVRFIDGATGIAWLIYFSGLNKKNFDFDFNSINEHLIITIRNYRLNSIGLEDGALANGFYFLARYEHSFLTQKETKFDILILKEILISITDDIQELITNDFIIDSITALYAILFLLKIANFKIIPEIASKTVELICNRLKFHKVGLEYNKVKNKNYNYLNRIFTESTINSYLKSLDLKSLIPYFVNHIDFDQFINFAELSPDKHI